MPTPTILLLSSTGSLIKAVESILGSFDNLQLVCMPSFPAARAYLQEDHTCLALLHSPAPAQKDTLEFLLSIRQAPRPVATVVLTDQGDADRGLLLERGAIDCLQTPPNVERLTWLIDVLTARERLGCLQPASAKVPRNDTTLVPGCESAYSAYYLNSPGMAELRALVRKIAPQNSTILLCGETGTGKTRLARVIHELSPRRHEQFIVVDCAALSGSLIESEIFGHVRGAFTGATRDYAGKFSAVGQGTLLLDEIDALSLGLQAKLLRAVDEHVFEPVGSTKSQPLLARLIVASNRSLENEVSSGRFRADLYHRLNVIGLYLPPLRERESAITALAQSFLAEFAAREGVPVTQITPDALQCLEQYPWPGNIRELRNAIQRAVTLTDASEIRLQDLPDPVRRVAAGCKQFSGPVTPTPSRSSAASNLAGIKEEAELARLIEVLRKHGKNRRQAARELGISRTALYNKLNKYGLADFRGRGDVPVAVPHPPGVSEDVADEALAQQTAELAS